MKTIFSVAMTKYTGVIGVIGVTVIEKFGEIGNNS